MRVNRARVVVMDLTGIPTVDAAVANHLVQTVEAARLVGAEVIVTGLSSVRPTGRNPYRKTGQSGATRNLHRQPRGEDGRPGVGSRRSHTRRSRSTRSVPSRRPRVASSHQRLLSAYRIPHGFARCGFFGPNRRNILHGRRVRRHRSESYGAARSTPVARPTTKSSNPTRCRPSRTRRFCRPTP